ncbi:hexokinase-domain-containing protein [Aspergillus recurvatus]
MGPAESTIYYTPNIEYPKTLSRAQRSSHGRTLLGICASSLTSMQSPLERHRDYPWFTFLYPVTQHSLRHGVLQRWTKEFSISRVEGHGVVKDFHEVLRQEGIPHEIQPLVNDTVSTLMASAFVDNKTQIGSIYGTGTNAAYMERCDWIQKVRRSRLPGDALMAINCEYGAFDNSEKVLPFTEYDIEIDRRSPRPGQQQYEKLVAGLDLGVLLRLILVELYDKNKTFRDQDGSNMKLL